MSKVVLKAEHISKMYRLGLVSTKTLSHDINRWFYRVRGKEDPYLKIGESNDRSTKGSSEYVWALKDVDFEINQGDSVGIIGRNGAGKSTLLKILSRVTQPTMGSLKVKGRIASLLEVGTGFHPELTGRENIYLNGAILGMRRKEITSKLDQIIDFSGVERYLDTPVKRYSSGMYVRLAFAVAAHLESDILIVDEVLAVGDAEFQKKCLGKMGDVSRGEGRTVLFVSHNLSAVETLCNKGILLSNGAMMSDGTAHDMVKLYLSHGSGQKRKFHFDNPKDAPGNSSVRILSAAITAVGTDDANGLIDINTPFDIAIELVNFTKSEILSIGFDIKTMKGDVVFGTGGKFSCSFNSSTRLVCHVPAPFLNDDLYTVHIYVHTAEMSALFNASEFLSFEIKDTDRESGYLGKINGFIRTNFTWEAK